MPAYIRAGVGRSFRLTGARRLTAASLLHAYRRGGGSGATGYMTNGIYGKIDK